jgi:hypothetical protein
MYRLVHGLVIETGTVDDNVNGAVLTTVPFGAIQSIVKVESFPQYTDENVTFPSAPETAHLVPSSLFIVMFVPGTSRPALSRDVISTVVDRSAGYASTGAIKTNDCPVFFRTVI